MNHRRKVYVYSLIDARGRVRSTTPDPAEIGPFWKEWDEQLGMVASSMIALVKRSEEAIEEWADHPYVAAILFAQAIMDEEYKLDRLLEYEVGLDG
jgi:hypothetical protein|tara:strand:+ start:20828 stop:21115 length:288 start_codon:yes stop_codon:yes gene_type:complete